MQRNPGREGSRIASRVLCARTLLQIVAWMIAGSKLDAQSSSSGVMTSGTTVHGVVLTMSGVPIPDARISTGRQRALTNEKGEFSLTTVGGDTVRFSVRRLGYEPVALTRVQIPGDNLEIEIRMAPLAQALGAVTINGVSFDRSLLGEGYYDRKRTASGRFLDQDAIEHFGGDGLGTLLRESPRVTVQRSANQDYAFGSTAGKRCRLNIFVDGMFKREAMPSPDVSGGRGDEGIGLSQLVALSDILAVEIYPSVSSVPTRFSRFGPGAGPQGRRGPSLPSPTKTVVKASLDAQDAACGALVVWTKKPV